MNDDIKRRAVLLVVLAGIGVTLAGVGAAFGIGSSPLATDRTGEVSIAGTNVTVSGSGTGPKLVGTVSKTSDIEIAERGGKITVREHEDRPLTQRERERAVDIAQTNRTIASYLQQTENAEIRVEPIRKLRTQEIHAVTVETDLNGTNHSFPSNDSVAMVNITRKESSDAVTIDRDPSYVEDQATVRIGPPGWTDPRYSVTVDLTNGTVTQITDWRDL
jgi:hypothetical protein